MKLVRLLLIIGALAAPVWSKDHAYGPWNIDLTGALQVESNSNVFYDESGGERDLVWHIMPEASFEYEELDNVLFAAGLKLDIARYSRESDASMTSTALHLEARPVHRGGYLVFTEDYERLPNYTPDGSDLLTTGVNTFSFGGGYAGNHLDLSAVMTSAVAKYTPSAYDGLNYAENSFDVELKYLHNSLYWLGGLGNGRLNYRSGLLNDARFWNLLGGIGKEFTPKTSAEFKVKYQMQNHDGSGAEDFRGLLFSLETKHMLATGKGSLTGLLEREIIPSSVVGADFATVTTIGVKSESQFNSLFTADFEFKLDTMNLGSRTDRVFNLGFDGGYMIRKGLSFDFGLALKRRSSDDSTVAFGQTRIFIGISGKY